MQVLLLPQVSRYLPLIFIDGEVWYDLRKRDKGEVKIEGEGEEKGEGCEKRGANVLIRFGRGCFTSTHAITVGSVELVSWHSFK